VEHGGAIHSQRIVASLVWEAWVKSFSGRSQLGGIVGLPPFPAGTKRKRVLSCWWPHIKVSTAAKTNKSLPTFWFELLMSIFLGVSIALRYFITRLAGKSSI